MAPRNPEQSDNVDTSKILADLAPNNTDLQKTFAGLTKFLRLEVRSTGKTPEVGDIRDAMMASIDAKVSAPDLKGNSQVQAIAMEMKARLYATGESGPKSQEELLKAFAEMNGALSSGI